MDPLPTTRIDLEPKTVVGGDGVRLAVTDTGPESGAMSILFMHGLSQSRLLWARQFDSFLADRFRLVAFDLRGHGHSEKPREGYREREPWAADVAAVIEQLELERPLVVAWSYAGLVLCDYLSVHGDGKLGGVVLMSSAARVGVPGAAEDVLPDALPEGFGSEADEAAIASLVAFVKMLTFYPLPASQFAWFVGLNALTPGRVRAALLDRELDNDRYLQALTVPTLVLHGERDVQISPTAGRRVAGLIPGAAHIEYASTGHAPFWEQAARTNSDLAKFADGIRFA
jgi:non-heme chloroperoxidase